MSKFCLPHSIKAWANTNCNNKKPVSYNMEVGHETSLIQKFSTNPLQQTSQQRETSLFKSPSMQPFLHKLAIDRLQISQTLTLQHRPICGKTSLSVLCPIHILVEFC